MLSGGRAIYFLAMERQAADRRRVADDRRATHMPPDRPPGRLADPAERRRAALGTLRRWFVGSRTAEALR